MIGCARSGGKGDWRPGRKRSSDDCQKWRSRRSWQEAIEREAKVPVLNLAMCAAEKSPLIESYPFRFGCAESREPILDERGQVAGVLVRSNDTIEGQVEVAIHRVEQGLFKVTVRIKNESPSTQTESQLVDLGLPALMGT